MVRIGSQSPRAVTVKASAEAGASPRGVNTQLSLPPTGTDPVAVLPGSSRLPLKVRYTPPGGVPTNGTSGVAVGIGVRVGGRTNVTAVACTGSAVAASGRLTATARGSAESGRAARLASLSGWSMSGPTGSKPLSPPSTV